MENSVLPRSCKDKDKKNCTKTLVKFFSLKGYSLAILTLYVFGRVGPISKYIVDNGSQVPHFSPSEKEVTNKWNEGGNYGLLYKQVGTDINVDRCVYNG